MIERQDARHLRLQVVPARSSDHGAVHAVAVLAQADHRALEREIEPLVVRGLTGGAEGAEEVRACARENGPRGAMVNAAVMTSRMLLEYDGRAFYGWARQPDQRTVQAESSARWRRSWWRTRSR